MLRLYRELELDVVPWVWNQLLHAEAHLPLFAIDAKDDGFDFVSNLQELLSAAQVLTPAHLADVQQTFYALRHFDECTVVGHNHNFSFDLVSNIDSLGHGVPRMSCELLDAKRNPLPVVVEVQNDHIETLLHFHHLFWMAHAAPAEVCDVNESIHTTEVDKDPV